MRKQLNTIFRWNRTNCDFQKGHSRQGGGPSRAKVYMEEVHEEVYQEVRY